MSAFAYSPPAGFGTASFRERTPDYGRLSSKAIGHIDAALVQAIAAITRSEARIIEAQGAFLGRIRETKAHEKLGFHFGDLARGIFQMDPRTARNRIALHRVISEHPNVREAFLSGRVSACQVLVIGKVLTLENEATWLELCRCSTVDDLVRRIRQDEGRAGSSGARLDDSAADHADFRSVSFEAPPVARLAWRDGLKLARQVLGWEAPVYSCVEAILAEAAPGDGMEEPVRSLGTGGRCSEAADHSVREDVAHRPAERAGERSAVPADHPSRDAGGRPSRPGLQAIRSARETLAHLEDLFADLDDLLDASPAESPRSLVDRVRSTQVIERPLRVFLGRLLRHLQKTGALYRLGYLRLEEFAAEHLRLSARATRDLCRECEVFSVCPLLEEAFASGRIGIRQAILIERFAPRGEIEPFIQRAGQVTFRQFAREMRLVECFDELGLGRYMKPLPQPGLLAGLVRELLGRGWPASHLAEELAARGLDEQAAWVLSDRSGPCPFDDCYPAETSLAPVEISVDLLLLSTFDPDDPRANDVRQTFSVQEDGLRDGRRSLRISFRAPEATIRHWHGAIQAIRCDNPLLPAWAGAMILLRRAVDVWTRVDPAGLPAHRKVLERDDYLCLVPGCTSRNQLETHHIQFRSRGGTNRRSNLATLCHAHHAHMLHRGAIRFRGRAPYDLEWEMGCAPGGGEPLWRLRGEKFTSRKARS